MPFDVILAGALGLSVLLFALAGGGGFWRGIVVALGAQGRAGHGAAAAHRASDRPALGGERALGGGLVSDLVERVRSSLRGLWDGAFCSLRLGYCGRLVAWGVPGISHRGPGGGAESLRVLRGDLREHEHHHALLSGYGCRGYSFGEAPVERKRAPRRRILPALDRPFPDHCRPPRRGDLRVSLGDLLDHRRCR